MRMITAQEAAKIAQRQTELGYTCSADDVTTFQSTGRIRADSALSGNVAQALRVLGLTWLET